MPPRFDFGDVFGRSLTALFPGFAAFAVVMLAVKTPVIVSTILDALDPTAGIMLDLTDLGIVGLDIVLAPLGSAFVAFGVVRRLDGEPASFGTCLAAVLSRAWPVVAVGAFVTLSTQLGCLLLVGPGLFLMCLLWAALPVAVVERTGVFAAVGRSVELTAGSRWWILLLYVVIMMVTVLLAAVAMALFELSNAIVFNVAFISVVAVLAPMWLASAQAVSYHALRDMRETVDVDRIASVFD